MAGSDMGGGGSRRAFRWKVVFLVGLSAGLLLLAAVAYADDMWFSSGYDVFGLAFAAVAAAAIGFWLYVLVTVLLEAWVLKAMLALTARQGFGYAVAANAASALVSLAWYVAGAFEGGWKTAMVKHEYGRALLLMLRSYAVTLCVEAFVLVLSLGKHRDTKLVLKATAVANAFSYAVSFLVLAVIAEMGMRRALGVR